MLISVVGTVISDNLEDSLAVSLQTTTIAVSICLIITFALWYQVERTLSIHTIYTRCRELFYWAAILFTFARGTSAGDLLAERLALGYGVSALLFGGTIALITAAYYLLDLNAILAFWLPHILTRLLGASCGDLLAQPIHGGGPGLGTIGTSIVFLCIIAMLVTYLARTRNPAPVEV